MQAQLQIRVDAGAVRELAQRLSDAARMPGRQTGLPELREMVEIVTNPRDVGDGVLVLLCRPSPIGKRLLQEAEPRR